MNSEFARFVSDPARQRLLEREILSLEATELISALLAEKNMTKVELANRLGSSKPHVTQVLSGSRNMTLHTFADFLFALGYRARLDVSPIESGSRFKPTAYRLSKMSAIGYRRIAAIKPTAEVASQSPLDQIAA